MIASGVNNQVQIGVMYSQKQLWSSDFLFASVMVIWGWPVLHNYLWTIRPKQLIEYLKGLQQNMAQKYV